MISELKEELKKISILGYLESIGLDSKGSTRNKIWFSSPFSSDSEPSFVVYKDQNTFHDFSNGKGGDIINLVMELHNTTFKDAIKILSKNKLVPLRDDLVTKKVSKEISNKEFKINSYLTRRVEDVKLIKKYADSRRITSEFTNSKYFEKKNEEWVKRLAIGFIHVDENLNLCGIKMRSINDSQSKARFHARGRMCYYVLDNIVGINPTLYITESETSSNSLYSLLKKRGDNFVILCVGGVSNYPEKIPDKYSKIQDVRIIIDYDGGVKDNQGNVKYEKHMEHYSRFGKAMDIKLSKADDINKLYVEGNENYILKLLNKK